MAKKHYPYYCKCCGTPHKDKFMAELCFDLCMKILAESTNLFKSKDNVKSTNIQEQSKI